MATKVDKLSGSNLMIILVLVTLLAVGGTALIVKILFGSIALDNKVVSAKSKAEKQLAADVTAAPQLVDAYSALGSQSQVLSDALPNVADFPSLIVTVDNMANDAGITLTSISPATALTSATNSIAAPPSTGTIATPVPSAYQFTIAFNGTYDSLIKLLGDIETSARPMRVDGVQTTGSGSALTGNLDVETYYQAAGQLPFGEETVK